MRTVLIAYNLAHAPSAYEPLTDAIRNLGAWWHHINNLWLVKVDRVPDDVRDLLQAHLLDGDELLVVDVSGSAVAWRGFDESGSSWLREKF
jgi:hypothetical protein